MERYTRKDAERAFDRLATALDKPHSADGGGSWRQEDGQNVATVGWWELDYYAIGGGFTIHEIANEGGGVHCPLGSMRRPARVFVDSCRFAMDAMDAKENGR